MYAIGYDIGSSSIKASLVEIKTGRVLARLQEPETEMGMEAPEPGWAEQDPEDWWHYVCQATRRILSETGVESSRIQSVGISYQMHGLVLVDENMRVTRPSIIWCDSRAIDYGEDSFNRLGARQCLKHCLNSPGNFTAAKWKWVTENQPEIAARSRYAMLPGDFIALRLSGQVTTTPTGLSEGILWDFTTNEPARLVLDDMGLDAKMIPKVVPTVGIQAHVSEAGAAASGLPVGIPIGYRAGDQPNNALSLNVLDPGEIAATAGTSGVVYGITDRLVADASQRVNGFAHVNHDDEKVRVGVLLCINGAGILHRWLKNNLGGDQLSYAEMETIAAAIPPGADGLSFLPFGNGAERMFGNQQPGAHLLGLDLNRHHRGHVIRAGIEGIAFAFVYGMQVMQDELGMDLSTIRVGNDNLFQSSTFARSIASLTGATIEVHNTTGAVGAALAGAAGAGLIDNLREATSRQEIVDRIKPGDVPGLKPAYERWRQWLLKFA